LRWSIDEVVPPFHGRDAFQLIPAAGAFPWDRAAPQPVLDRDAPLLNPNLGQGPFYGNYVGPQGTWDFAHEPPPLTPVDKAAYQHDHDYFDIYQRYGYSEFEYGLSFTRELDRLFGTDLSTRQGAVEAFGWLGQLNSLDPGMEMELAWADLKLTGRSWGYIGEG